MNSLPQIPSIPALIVLVITIFSLILFTNSRIKLELSSLIIIALLILLFSFLPETLPDPSIFFKFFGHEAVISVCGLMIIGNALVNTGALEPIGHTVANKWKKKPTLYFFITLIFAAICSAFMNNTPIVVMFLPILISVCQQTNQQASKVLLPMGFATLVGGMSTTIGTSTNLLVVSVSNDILGYQPFSLFAFAVPAIIAAIVALLYLGLIAPKLLNSEKNPITIGTSPRLFEARLHLSENSKAIDKPLLEVIAMTKSKMHVVHIQRNNQLLWPLPDMRLKADDQLHIFDTPINLKNFEAQLKATLYSGNHIVDDSNPLEANEDQQISEILITDTSPLKGTPIKFNQFLKLYEFSILALHRGGKKIWGTNEDLEEISLESGDILLIQFSKDQAQTLMSSDLFFMLDATKDLPKNSKAPIALSTIALIVGITSMNILNIATSALLGVVILLLTKCISFKQALQSVNPSVFFIVVASLCLGTALHETGATTYLADLFLYATSGLSPEMILSSLMLSLAILTNVISNNAAAVIGTPISITIANKLGLPPEPFILAVLFGANLSYATPMAYKTNLLVMTAGNYSFNSFLKVGLPLIALMWITLSLLLIHLYL